MIPHDPRVAPADRAATPPTVKNLTELAYELLDAHWDTAQITSDWNLGDAWEAHLRYLRDLQRVARGLLADTGQWPRAEAGRRVLA